MMTPGKWMEGDVSEDGHPCEAALEFRRIAVRSGLADEIPADALDLAISFSWIGKAVSRTVDAASWIMAGTDPNTWQMIRAMAVEKEARRLALSSAVGAKAAPCFSGELSALRASAAFNNAVGQVAGAIDGGGGRMVVLGHLAARLPCPQTDRVPDDEGNLVLLDTFRKRLRQRN